MPKPIKDSWERVEMLRILCLFLWLTVLPIGIGYGILREDDKLKNTVAGWLVGQLVLWCVFFAICVPMTLLGKSFTDVFKMYFVWVAFLFLLSLIRIVIGVKKRRSTMPEQNLRTEGEKCSKTVLLLWGVCLVLFLIQMICVFALAYEEGDDAFYVAVTTMSKDADRLYTKIPYTGEFTGLSGRYALAPFPVWVAVLAKIAELSGAATSHVIMPVFIICMFYAIVYLIGSKLIGNLDAKATPWMLPLFFGFMELLVIFGGYSTYSRENFLLVRAGQGKAVLANVIMLFLFYLIMRLLDKLETGEKTGCAIWFLFELDLLAGCLCSTMGSFLLCMMLGLCVFCAAAVYHRWKLLLCLVPSMLLPGMIVLLYLKL